MAFGRLPKTTQNRPKRLSRASFFQLRFRLRFLINFGAILAPKMAPSGHPFRDPNRPQHRSKFDLEKRWPQESPKTRQELPREAPGRPKSSPRAPPGGPGTPQELPGRPQEAPRRLPRRPKSRKSSSISPVKITEECELQVRCWNPMFFLFSFLRFSLFLEGPSKSGRVFLQKLCSPHGTKRRKRRKGRKDGKEGKGHRQLPGERPVTSPQASSIRRPQRRL